eukprot:s353_g14.t1
MDMAQCKLFSLRYLVLWSRLRCWRSFRRAPGQGELRWANAWSADLKDVDVVTVYGRPGDSFMQLAAEKMDQERHSLENLGF